MHRLPLLLLFAGCAADSGALGNAAVGTECSPTDFACVTNGLDGPVAVGGVVPLSLDAETAGTANAPMTLMSADSAVIKAPARPKIAPDAPAPTAAG